jgi:ABC-type taurine transport system substrate-binding protein
LYDLEKDPAAREDLAPARPETCADFKARIEAWLQRSAAVRPVVRMSGDADREEMEALGYIGDD